MDRNYASHIVLIANTPTQAESQLHSQEREAGGIGFHLSADETEYMCFNQKGDISFEISEQVHLPRKQRFINWEWHQ